MTLSQKIILGTIVAVLLLWGLETLIVSHFMDQFAGQKGSR